jgi:hypothetical protein
VAAREIQRPLVSHFMAGMAGDLRGYKEGGTEGRKVGRKKEK